MIHPAHGWVGLLALGLLVACSKNDVAAPPSATSSSATPSKPESPAGGAPAPGATTTKPGDAGSDAEKR